MPPMFLNGGGMRGGPVHDHIEGVPLLGELRTAPKYRYYSVRDDPALSLSPRGAQNSTTSPSSRSWPASPLMRRGQSHSSIERCHEQSV